MNEVALEYEDLNALLPEGFASCDYQEYWKWETKVIVYFQLHGWRECRFIHGERDSFGPLTRVMHGIDRDRRHRRLVYG